MPDHSQAIETAFTAQAVGDDASPATNATEALDAIVALAAPTAEQTWLDVACGTGIVSRHPAETEASPRSPSRGPGRHPGTCATGS